jgi:phosphoribosylcarboxyaminoimidazole (NCAIR) mutase
MSAEERALKVFDSDADTEIMKAYVNFISEMGRSYKDRAETA